MKKLFIDMDGVLAEYKWSGKGEEWKKGHFLSLAPNVSIIKAIQRLAKHENTSLYILSALLPDSDYCKPEKMVWLIRYLPEIPEENWIFTKPGFPKPFAIRRLFGELNSSFLLLDDYTSNLREWEDTGGVGIKYYNGVNGKKGTWEGLSISHEQPSEEIEDQLHMWLSDR